MVPLRRITQFLEDSSVPFFLCDFAALREVCPFVPLSIRKRIRLSRKIALFDLSANEDRKVPVDSVFALN